MGSLPLGLLSLWEIFTQEPHARGLSLNLTPTRSLLGSENPCLGFPHCEKERMYKLLVAAVTNDNKLSDLCNT